MPSAYVPRVFGVIPAQGPVAKPDIQRLRLLRFARNDSQMWFLSLRGAKRRSNLDFGNRPESGNPDLRPISSIKNTRLANRYPETSYLPCTRRGISEGIQISARRRYPAKVPLLSSLRKTTKSLPASVVSD